MNRTTDEVYTNELNPALYEHRAGEVRRRKIEELAGGVLILSVLLAVFAFVQIAYGIW